MKVLSFVVLAVPLLSSVARGDVLVVDPLGGAGVDFTSLQAAADAAGEGDTLLVRGSHAGLVVSGKSLNVIADTGGQIALQHVAIANLAANQWFSMRGADVGSFLSSSQPLQLTQLAGNVFFEGCSFSAPAVSSNTKLDAARLTNVANATFARCAFLGGTAAFGAFTALDGTSGLVASGSEVHLFECTVGGGQGGDCGSTGSCFAGDGGSAAIVAGGSLLVYGSALTGGDGGAATGTCVGGGAHGGNGGATIVSLGALVRVTDPDLTPGLGGLAVNSDIFCLPDDGSDGLQVAGSPAAFFPGPARAFSASSPHRTGESVDISVGGLPGDLVFMVLATDQAPQWLAPFQATLVPRIVGILPLGVVPGSGSFQFAVPLGNLGPGVEALLFYGQAAFLPPAGTLVLGPPTAVTVLDGAF